MVDQDFEKEGMNFSTPMKDSKFITELSRENLVALPIYQVALQYYYSAVASGLGKKDASSVIKIIERNANFSR
jgi:3-hydroxyisobutyrate dehydrogenase-like beta-hydroxyacid dehydrogenase